MTAIAVAWAALTTGAALALAGTAPHALRPVLATTALILALAALAALIR